ncbi:MAG: hypothetical protein H6837_17025 [Planctomycetes bacterium]|nr:hypothetical protein [Planctomycetota bacterium]
MKGNKAVVAILVLLVVLLLAGAIAAASMFGVESVMVDAGPGLAARRNPLLAAERMLSAMGVSARSMHGYQGPPPARGALILTGDRAGLIGHRLDVLSDWVTGGGHLLVVVRYRTDPKLRRARGRQRKGEDEITLVADELLTRLGIEASEADSDSAKAVELRAQLPGTPRDTATVAMRPRADLDSIEEASFRIVDDSGNCLLRSIEAGLGRVTAMVDDSWLKNDAIGKHQHATLLWRLVGSRHPTEVWIVHGDWLPSFWVLVATLGWPALLAFGLLLVIWIWKSGARFGPPLPDVAAERRSLLEHLDAAGRFLWRCRVQEPMLRPLREHIAREIAVRRPSWSSLTSDQRIEQLAAASGFDEARIRSALLEDPGNDAQQFVRVVRDLEELSTRL